VILVDSSVWIDHLRTGDPVLAGLLDRAGVLGHVFVRGELACGNLRRRDEVLALLADLPQAVVATDNEVLELIERHRLMRRGIGYVDAHLLAATLLTGGARLWTRDLRLAEVAKQLGVGARPAE
jgi:predicted nucleic acid-binding protein